MSTITRELAKLFRKITNSEIDAEGNAHVVLSPADSLLINNARIALASLEAGPVYFVEIEDGQDINAGRIEGKNRPDLSLLPDGINHLYAAPPAPAVPAELHPDTQKLVTDFCTALAEKLYKAQLKYGYDADWKQDGWPTQCQAHFHQHIAKGDPRDVAAYCAFMWYHGWKTEPAPVSVPDAMEMDDDFDSAFEHGKAVGWNAYRAAMLAAPAVQAEQTKLLIGWRTTDYTEETSDPEMAKNWAAVVGVLPVFEGDINTRLQAEQLSVDTLANVLRNAPVAPCDSQGKKRDKSPAIPDGWIPVSERMPDETQPVIVVADGGVVQRTIYQFCDGVWIDWYEQYDEVPHDAFTHWMPLPAAPKQEAE